MLNDNKMLKHAHISHFKNAKFICILKLINPSNIVFTFEMYRIFDCEKQVV